MSGLLFFLAVLCSSQGSLAARINNNNYHHETISLKSGVKYTFEYKSAFSKPDVIFNYEVLSPEGTTISAVCNIKLRCTERASMYVVDKTHGKLLDICSPGYDFLKTPEVKSPEKMIIQMNSGKTSLSRYACELIANPTVQKCECGESLKGRIVNGVPVMEGEIPWQVSLQWEENNVWHYYCGGSILSADYVVTAAHCLKSQQTLVKLYVGSTDVFRGGHRIGISKIFQHMRYDVKLTLNDITLIKTDRPIRFNDRVSPVCLPRSLVTETFAGKSLVVSGFGKLYEGGPTSEKLMKTTLIGVNQQDCINAFGKYRIKNTMLCAGAPNTDSCQTDSGGPLTYKSPEGIHYLAGIVSWGAECADPNHPGVYTRVTSYLDWIDSLTEYKICSR